MGRAKKIEAVEQPSVVEQTMESGGDVNPIVTAGFDLDKLREEHKTKSGVIRALAGEGFATKHICKFMGIRYQHVRNVLVTPLKRPAD